MNLTTFVWHFLLLSLQNVTLSNSAWLPELRRSLLAVWEVGVEEYKNRNTLLPSHLSLKPHFL